MSENEGKSTTELTYPLPHGSAETNRLIQQSAFINPFTRSLFIDAGIGSGMAVLDVGSGAGDVALIAAELAGLQGSVVGLIETRQGWRSPEGERKRPASHT